MSFPRLLLPFAAALALALAGCGGGGGARSVASGQAVIRIHWPTSSRSIPGNADQIVVTLTKGSTDSTLPTIVKPPDSVLNANGGVTVTQVDLAEGTYTVVAKASNSANGVVLAQGTDQFTVTAGRAASFDVTMGTTLARYKVTDLGYHEATDGAGVSPKAFDPPTFYIGPTGGTNDAGGGLTPTFSTTRDRTRIMVTAQSASNDLLLLPPGSAGTSTQPRIVLSAEGGGLSVEGAAGDGTYSLPAPPAPPTPDTTSQRAVIDHVVASDTVGSLQLDYYDYVYTPVGSSGSFVATLLKTFRAPINIGTTTETGFTVHVGNLPTDYASNPNRYNVVATLYENDLGSDKGRTYPGNYLGKIVEPAPSNAVVGNVSFGNVEDRGRGFTIDIAIQLKTEGAGFVDYAFYNSHDIPISGTQTFDIPDQFSVGTNSANKHDKRKDGYEHVKVAPQTVTLKRGNGTDAGTFTDITGITVQIETGVDGSSNPVYAAAVLDSDLFTHRASNPIDPDTRPDPQPGDPTHTKPAPDEARLKRVGSTAATYWNIAANSATLNDHPVSTLFDVTFLASGPPTTADPTKPSGTTTTGSIGVLITPNGGHLGGGVN